MLRDAHLPVAANILPGWTLIWDANHACTLHRQWLELRRLCRLQMVRLMRLPRDVLPHRPQLHRTARSIARRYLRMVFRARSAAQSLLIRPILWVIAIGGRPTVLVDLLYREGPVVVLARLRLLAVVHVFGEVGLLLLMLVLHSSTNNCDSRPLHGQSSHILWWTAHLPTMHLKATHMDQILHISLARPHVLIALPSPLPHISPHHLLLEVVGHFHIAEHAVEVDRAQLHGDLHRRLLEVDHGLCLLLVDDDAADAFEPLPLVHRHFPLVEDEEAHQPLHHSHPIVRLSGYGVRCERQFHQVWELDQLLQLMELRDPVGHQRQRLQIRQPLYICQRSQSILIHS